MAFLLCGPFTLFVLVIFTSCSVYINSTEIIHCLLFNFCTPFIFSVTITAPMLKVLKFTNLNTLSVCVIRNEIFGVKVAK